MRVIWCTAMRVTSQVMMDPWQPHRALTEAVVGMQLVCMVVPHEGGVSARQRCSMQRGRLQGPSRNSKWLS